MFAETRQWKEEYRFPVAERYTRDLLEVLETHRRSALLKVEDAEHVVKDVGRDLTIRDVKYGMSGRERLAPHGKPLWRVHTEMR